VVFQLILLGVIFSLLALVCDGGWGLLAGTARIWLATDVRRIVILRSAGGLVMIVLGILVLVSAVQNHS
jgi:threonine/homoserine/homoserine lactone efflux protein